MEGFDRREATMNCSTPAQRQRFPQLLPYLAAAALTLAPAMARAQQPVSHPAPPARHPIVMMTPPRTAPTLMQPAVRTGAPFAAPRAGVPLRWLLSPSRFPGTPPVATGAKALGRLSAPDLSESILEAPGFFQPFFLSAPFPGEFGFALGSERLPLGFGLWPACDSASNPGVFWTVGPCFGIGSYSEELAPVVQSEYPLGFASISGYVFPTIFLATQPSGAAAQPAPGALAPPPTMILYFTDGKTVPAADWWVVHGRLQYVTDTGAAGVIDLSQLDLEQTIKQNETRGLQFHLRFTPPVERP